MALNIDLENFAGGELAEKFEDAMEKVIANMMDPNTPYKNKRKITINLSLEQNEDRSDVAIDCVVKTTLAPVKSATTRMSIGKNLLTGELFAEEYGSAIRGQARMEDYADEKGNYSIEQKKEASQQIIY
ncbi:hypothetical protein GKG47_11650 [Lactonifactor sp. BIOML-A3]|uniref:hypothetical protein n=1 Tax=unclassified Lactonifactor TaxID=2636670 RepID=UPI0012B127DB|nr:MULTISPECIES: hypothetical protein [unclassified Lactonifactor]MSA01082.1 hypothetical protein [Lactonifactor sp. BIOML-A5]MSA09881.1 hypothetical protein [Lactonifactor sp. BIOML-A4]MSA13083.1 hypothetical protein [Lactonifactor sp. BIOML-A3]MSA18619.1 hypothetical protein [Lactonifactor sp. BIOML-A2]MSA38322.1 hypothetical protein [Lactonifactor sp. BIOML-A1]